MMMRWQTSPFRNVTSEMSKLQDEMNRLFHVRNVTGEGTHSTIVAKGGRQRPDAVDSRLQMISCWSS